MSCPSRLTEYSSDKAMRTNSRQNLNPRWLKEEAKASIVSAKNNRAASQQSEKHPPVAKTTMIGNHIIKDRFTFIYLFVENKTVKINYIVLTLNNMEFIVTPVKTFIQYRPRPCGFDQSFSSLTRRLFCLNDLLPHTYGSGEFFHI